MEPRHLTNLTKLYGELHELAQTPLSMGAGVLPTLIAFKPVPADAPENMRGLHGFAMTAPVVLPRCADIQGSFRMNVEAFTSSHPDGFVVLMAEAFVKRIEADSIEGATREAEKYKPGDPRANPAGCNNAIVITFAGKGWQALAFSIIDEATNTLDKGELRFVGQDDFVTFQGGMVVAEQGRPLNTPLH